jgi:peptidoglycan hydrolase CwlO-like protein
MAPPKDQPEDDPKVYAELVQRWEEFKILVQNLMKQAEQIRNEEAALRQEQDELSQKIKTKQREVDELKRRIEDLKRERNSR